MPDRELYKGVSDGKRQIAELPKHYALYEYEFVKPCAEICACFGTRGQNTADKARKD